tara:strand:- start:875 stop:1501 length:627 start_codon:yes stop_codon:yes gene_type:complete
MAVGTVAEIKASAADWLNRSDLTSQIDDFFNLTITEVSRKLDVTLMDAVETHTITSVDIANGYFFDPPSALEIQSITDSKGRSLDRVPFEEYRKYIDATGNTKVYALADTKIFIGPTPSEGEVYTIVIKQLGNSNMTNYPPTGSIYVAFNDVFLYGILHNAYMYLKDDNRVAIFKAKYDEAILEANKQMKTVGRIKDDSIAQYGGPLI